MDLYTFAERLSNATTFQYVLIIVVFLFFFNFKTIGLNIILALILAVIYIMYIHSKSETEVLHEEREKELKHDSIKPKPEEFEGLDDIVNFVYSIQDMYDFNPLSFEEMIDNIDALLKIRNLLKRGVKNCDYYYQIAESKKNNALNAFHSIIFQLPTSKLLIDKLTRAHKRMETVLNRYINELYDLCYYDLVKQGYHIERRAINLGPKEHNHYFDKDFTYQIY